MKIAYVCICSNEYLGHYRVLYNSLKQHAQYVKQKNGTEIKIADQILYYLGPMSVYEVRESNNFDKIVSLDNAYINCHKSYNTLERICSLRPRVVLDAFEKGYDIVVFLGAKVEFFADPFKLVDSLKVIQDPCNAVVTPHILEPLPEDGKFPSNASVSFTGHISTDVVSFRKCPEIIEFLTWQDEIMKTKVKTTKETYLDQSWLNFLPFFVPNVKILRDPGYNVAYWNYKQRNLWKSSATGKWLLKNKNETKYLTCFQYSGLDLNNPENISTHQNRYKAEGDFLEFLKEYAEKVK